MSESPNDPNLTGVERALAGLAPSLGRLNRDALLFAAGRRSVRRGWAWPCASAASALAATVLAAILIVRPEPEVRDVVVHDASPPAEVPAAAPEQSSPTDSPPRASASPLRPEPDYLTLWHQVERWGDGGLPPPPVLPTTDERPPPATDPLDLPPDLRSDPWLQRSKAMLTPGGAL